MSRKVMSLTIMLFAAVLLFGLSPAMRADSCAVKAYAGKTTASSLFLQTSVYTLADATVSPTAQLYLNTGTWNYSGTYVSFSTYVDGNKSQVASGTSAGWLNGRVLALVTYTITKTPAGATTFNVVVTNYNTRALIYSSGNLPILSGTTVINLPTATVISR